MANAILIYTGSAVIILWGITHLIPTKAVVNGFEPVSEDNKRIIAMEWMAEGLTLCFKGLLVLFATMLQGCRNPATHTLYIGSGLMLAVMAGLTFFTGFKTSIAPIKFCPFVKITVAALFLPGSVL
ncbi:MAG: hypothetical protein AB1500_05560 [Bacillota bacterium]